MTQVELVAAIAAVLGIRSSGGHVTQVYLNSAGQVPVYGTFVTTPPQSATASAPAQISVSGTASTILAANAARKRLKVQNTGTTKIYLAFAGQTPTVTAYHTALPACGTANDGTSPQYIDGMELGAVQAISSASGGTVVVEEDT